MGGEVPFFSSYLVDPLGYQFAEVSERVGKEQEGKAVVVGRSAL